MDDHSAEELDSQSDHPLSLAVNDQQVVEDDQGQEEIEQQIDMPVVGVTIKTSENCGNGSEGTRTPDAQDVKFEQLYIRPFSRVVAHEGVVGDAEEEGEGAGEEVHGDERGYQVMVRVVSAGPN